MVATAAILAISIGSGIAQNQASQKAKGVSGAAQASQDSANAALLAQQQNMTADAANQTALATTVAAQARKRQLGAQGRDSTIKTAGPLTSQPTQTGAGGRTTLLGL